MRVRCLDCKARALPPFLGAALYVVRGVASEPGGLRDHSDPSGVVQGSRLTLGDPSELVIYVVSYDQSPVRECSAKSWVSDALDFGYRVVYYGQNASHQSRTGDVVPSRTVPDYGALSGARDDWNVWPRFTANILRDILEFAPGAKLVMRMDDDSVLHPQNLWRALGALSLDAGRDWMLGDCGKDEHHAVWCGGGAGIVLSRPLAEKLAVQMLLGVRSVSVCAVTGRNDDDTMGGCATALRASIISHRGFHSWAPASLGAAGPLPCWTWQPWLSSWLGGPLLDGCPAERLGTLVVVQDWITYHHVDCKVQHELSSAIRARGKLAPTLWQLASLPACAGKLVPKSASRRSSMDHADRRCARASEITRRALCQS